MSAGRHQFLPLVLSFPPASFCLYVVPYFSYIFRSFPFGTLLRLCFYLPFCFFALLSAFVFCVASSSFSLLICYQLVSIFGFHGVLSGGVRMFAFLFFYLCSTPLASRASLQSAKFHQLFPVFDFLIPCIYLFICFIAWLELFFSLFFASRFVLFSILISIFRCLVVISILSNFCG